ncbi:MAG: hypothetical protein RL531_829 [Actinomycetota bacterium]|jgi:hypothetical protein
MSPDETLPFGDDTDDAVVAMLDGRLAEFAAAHDLSEAAARERLERWPGLGARISTVVAARRGTRRAWRRPRNLGVLAGAIIGVAGVVAFAVVLLTGSADEPARKAGAGHSHTMDSYIGSVGEIGTDEALRAAIVRRGRVDVGLAADPTATSLLNGSGLSIAAERCVRVNLPGRTVSLLATGTWQEQPAVVYVAEVTDARVAFVSDLAECAILYSLRL